MQEQISNDKILEDIRDRFKHIKKLIVTDLDGTLLNNNSELPQEYVEEIKGMLSPEVKLTIASGRGYPSVKTFADRFPIDVPVICEAGAVVVDPVTEEIIYQQFIEEDVVKAIIDHLVRKRYRCNLYLYRGNSMICYKRPEVPVFTEKEPAPVVNTDLSDIPPEAIVGVRKVSIILEEEYLNQLKEELRELLGDKIDVMRADDGCLDIMAIGVTKGSALQHMLQICGIDPEHVLAIGDNESDATMFDVVKFSVAVANADDFTKSKASFVTSSNEDKGVLLAIKRFLEAQND